MKAFIQNQRWCCIQEQTFGRPWIYELSISYTRSESIKKMLENTSLDWLTAKRKYGWRCVKIEFTIKEL